MTTLATAPQGGFGGALARTLSDGGTITWRNLMNIRRNPELLLSATVQPIMFVLLFAYVFGGSIGDDPVAYRDFLMGGIFVQTVAFNSAFTVIGMANDLQKGIIDRFRSLPMSNSAVLLGRTLSDLAVTTLGLLVMSLCGLLIGWRIRGSVTDAVLAYLMLLLFAFAMAWVGSLIALISGSVEVAQSAGFIWIFPVTFISTVFVAADRLPGPLQVFAEWNPISALSDSVRSLFGNHQLLPPTDAWPQQNPTLYALISCVVLIAVFMPLAVSKYRKVAAK
ncbi:ABC transporter permease [Thermocrispum municipale]|jgi:ABC transporter DrrB family efflux protein|uniref:ABC transporter permease n=1 Tax=Thermocrispum municipale TaxID=37926 RepID=UPI00041CA4CB|nr:ABC transporter permease [Thermocrispum municipale]